MKLTQIDDFQKFGIYGLISNFIIANEDTDNPRVLAYNLLKEARQIAKKYVDKRLNQIPLIAFDLSRHESVYRNAALLYIELNEGQQAIECFSYLHNYYQDNDANFHEQYGIIKQKIIDGFISESDLDQQLAKSIEAYPNQKAVNCIKDFSETLPETAADEQAIYFGRVYRHFGTDAVLTSITNDVRFNGRQKAVLLIRASRAVAAISDEGPSIESLFANKALELDTSDTVIKNSYQAYLRAGDLNKLTQLKDQYPELL